MWFREKRARYWVVDETRLSYNVNNGSSYNSDNTSAAIKAEITEWLVKEEGKCELSIVAIEIDSWL
jgi:hypothetical protein